MKILNKFSLEEATNLLMDNYRGVSSKQEFTAEERQQGARELLKDLGKNYEANKTQVFAIISEVITKALPERLKDTISPFAELKEFREGDTPRFVVRTGDIKAYSVATGGSVQRHRLNKKTITPHIEATQVAVYEELPRVLAGLVDFNEVIDEALDSLEDALYKKIYQSLADIYESLPDANKVSGTKIEENKLDRLIQIVGGYGRPMIVGTRLGLADLPIVNGRNAEEDIYNKGFLGKYKGCPVLEMRNITTDESNEEFELEDRYIYIIPEGKEKLVKVAIEGKAYSRELNNQADWTVNFETMVQNGVAVLETHHIAIYDNTSLAKGE